MGWEQVYNVVHDVNEIVEGICYFVYIASLLSSLAYQFCKYKSKDR